MFLTLIIGREEMTIKLDKKLFDKVADIAIKWHDVKHLFDMRVETTWGYHYSDKDMDEIIDAIDYGSGGLSYERFKELMEKNID